MPLIRFLLVHLFHFRFTSEINENKTAKFGTELYGHLKQKFNLDLIRSELSLYSKFRVKNHTFNSMLDV